jgi:hypothetical protein
MEFVGVTVGESITSCMEYKNINVSVDQFGEKMLFIIALIW